MIGESGENGISSEEKSSTNRWRGGKGKRNNEEGGRRALKATERISMRSVSSWRACGSVCGSFCAMASVFDHYYGVSHGVNRNVGFSVAFGHQRPIFSRRVFGRTKRCRIAKIVLSLQVGD